MAFDPISAALDIGGKLIDRLWPDPAQRDQAKLALMQMQQSGELAELAADTELAKGQLEVNKAEAANENVFISGWRPFIGWVCGSAFAYHFLLQPAIAFIATARGTPIALPSFDMSALNTVLDAMLGLGAMRTFDKHAPSVIEKFQTKKNPPQ